MISDVKELDKGISNLQYNVIMRELICTACQGMQNRFNTSRSAEGCTVPTGMWAVKSSTQLRYIYEPRLEFALSENLLTESMLNRIQAESCDTGRSKIF